MNWLLAQDALPPWLEALFGSMSGTAIAGGVLYLLLTKIIPGETAQHAKEIADKDAQHAIEREAWETLMAEQEERHKNERAEWLAALRDIKKENKDDLREITDKFAKEIAEQRLEKHDLRGFAQKLWADHLQFAGGVREEIALNRKAIEILAESMGHSAEVTKVAAASIVQQQVTS